MITVTSSCRSCHATYRGQVTTCPNCKAAIEADRPLAAGDLIDGKYEVVSLLGMGGMGNVYKVRHAHLNVFRAVKMLRRDLPMEESYRSRFIREAQLATRVQHPNIALVHDFATLPDGTFYMVSEFIEGVTLRQWVQRYGQFSLQLALQIAMQVLSGLEVICRASLIHRDISPDNIMITTGIDEQPVAKIIDLGIAKAISADIPMAEATQAGLFVGNPRYSSPEQLGALREGDAIDARIDLYSFGLVLYEMIAGQAPFVSNTPQGYAIKQLTHKPLPLREQRSDLLIPEALDAAILKALEKNRDNRYSSAHKMALALAPFHTGTLTQTTQAKLGTLGEKAVLDRLGAGVAAPRITLTPPPTDEQVAAEHARAEREFLGEVEALARRGNISGLSQLAALHPRDNVIGNAARAALDRMAHEALAAQALREQASIDTDGNDTLDVPPPPIMDVSTVAILLPNAVRSQPKSIEEEQMERHRRERAAFHGAIDALQVGDPLPAEKILREAPAPHIRQRLQNGLDEHYSSLAWALAANSADPREVRAFIEKYPNNRSSLAASERLRQLEQRGSSPAQDRETQAWNNAVHDGSEAAWLQFMELYSGSSRARKAVTMLAEARDYRRAIATGTELALRVYIATWPRGRHHAEVATALQARISAHRTPAPAPLPPQPPSATPARALPLTRVEMIPGTASEPLPVRLPQATDQLPFPSQPKSVAGLEDRWVYAMAIAIASAILIVLALWWKG